MGVQKCCGQERCTENNIPLKNDRRCQLINEVKQLIGNIEHAEKATPRPSRRPDRAVSGVRDLDDECRPWRKRRDCTPPLITAIAIHETRTTSDYSNMQHENSSQVTYVDGTKEGQEWRKVPPAPWDLPRSPSQELRAGTLYSNCECLKRNGLQHDCPRWECGGRPECVAVNPGPCCVPSQWPKPIRGDRRHGNQLTQETTSATGGVNFGGKPLKTGPLNPEICIPLGSQQQQQLRQGPSGNTGQEAKVTDGRNIPHGLVGLIEISSVSQVQNPNVSFQNVTGNVPNQAHQVTQTAQQYLQGRGHPEVIVLDLTRVRDVQGKPPQAQTVGQEPSQGIVLKAPGVACCCKPVKEEPNSGNPGRFQNRQVLQNPQRPATQGIMPSDQGMIFYCNPERNESTSGSPPGFQRQLPQFPQRQEQGITPAPGMVCCRLVQSAPAP